MAARDPDEAHRSATPLELFFDLTFVVAVAQAADGLQQNLEIDHFRTALVGYPLVFFGIWWAWINLTWFASAYDIDDVAYRVAVLVQMTGVLVLAAGIPRAFSHFDFGVMVLGYVIMRLAMVSLWIRAAISVPATRRSSIRYAVGITVIQVGWVGWLALPFDLAIPAFCVLALMEMALPVWAESAARTSWHPGHIAERYGLFTIIVLGEILLVTSLGVRSALDAKSTYAELAYVVAGGLLTVFSMWWLYFDLPAEEMVADTRQAFSENLTGAFRWGYGHYLVFAGAAATSAGLGLAIDKVAGHSHLSGLATGLALSIPVALYILVVWFLHFPYKPSTWVRNIAVPVAVVLIVASGAMPEPALVTGLLMLALVVMSIAVGQDSRPNG